MDERDLSFLSFYLFVVKAPRSERPFRKLQESSIEWFALTDDEGPNSC